MRKLLLLLFVVLFQGCLGRYTNIALDSVDNIAVESVSMFSSRFTASSTIINKSGKELSINGVEIYLEKVDGIHLSIDSPIVIPRGVARMDISANLFYSPMSFVELISSFDHGSLPLKIVLKLPMGNVKLRKTIESTELLNFLNRVRK